jgi:anti-sigma factor RsiW
MNCEWVQQNVTLYLYNELPDDARFELEQHVKRCPPCAAVLEEFRDLHAHLDALPKPEVTPNLLASARMELQERLETAEQLQGWRRFVLDPVAWLHRWRFSPVLAAVIFIAGFGAGLGTMYRVASSVRGATSASLAGPQSRAEASISGIRAIQQEAGTNQIKIQYDKTTPEQVQGSLSDPEIQQLLLYATRNNYNSGVRMDSIDLLRQKPEDGRIREGLVFALRYDSNPGVRLKALEAVTPYVRGDIRVRNAVLEALLNDNNPGIRMGALHALEASRADTSVRQALQGLAKDDPNPYIRTESRKMLAAMPEID